jgi:choline dehydrogenase
MGLKHNTDFNNGVQAGAGFFQVNQKNGRRAPQYNYLKDAIKSRVEPTPADHLPSPPLGNGDAKMTGCNVRSDSLVTRVLFEDPHNKTRATGVEYLHGKFLYHAIAAKEVILCAGALHSPQILMLSGIGDSYKLNKIGVDCLVDNKNVGQHFKEHAIVPLTASTTLESQVHNPIYTSNGAQLGAYVKMDPQGKLPDLKSDQSKADMQYNIAADCWDADILDKGFKGNALTIGCCFNEPLSEGWLEILSSDPTVQPMIYLNSFSHPDDMKRMISGVRFAKKLLEHPTLKKDAGVENLSFSDKYGDPSKWGHGDTDAELEVYIRYKAKTSFHPMCSARMGADANHGVVDAFCKVYGTTGLRVIDASVFPDYISGNLNAPTAMLAHRMGELIKKGH